MTTVRLSKPGARLGLDCELTGVYEALGGEPAVEQPFTWDGMDLVEAGYGFRDLPALVAAGGAATVLH